MDKEKDWWSREKSSDSFQKVNEKCCLEQFFVVTVLTTYKNRIFLIEFYVFACLLGYSKH